MAVVAAYLTATPGTFGVIVRRGEVAIELDEPPWDRFLDRPVARFRFPGRGKPNTGALFTLALAAFSVR
jgi:hypothetical protein